jgi:hypothetical protein
MAMPRESALADEIQAMQEATRAKVPAEALAPHADWRAQLDRDGVPVGVAKAGDRMPDARLLDHRGYATTITSLRAGRPPPSSCSIAGRGVRTAT